METTKVLIVGAGPAGSVCGYLLQKAGVPCILIDHATFPRDKICGGGLTSKCWHLLQQLMPDFKYDFNPVHHIRLDLKLCQKRGLDMEAITRWAQKIIDDVLAEDEKPLEHVIK